MKIVVIGSGTMGKGVHNVLSKNGLESYLLNSRFDEELQPEIQIRVSEADLIIECISENFIEKSILHANLSQINNYGILASCTSSLSIKDLQEKVNNPGRFLGIHFMNPASLIPWVEVVPGPHTSNEVLRLTIKLLSEIDRKVVIVQDTPGFALNAILFSMLNRAAYFFEKSGVRPEIIDKLMEGVCSHKLGPLATLDLIGLDTAQEILFNLHARDSEMNLKPAPVIKEMIAQGKLGKKTGTGFYDYKKS
jgi:3-hydroxyacyl-CoA dehydrogenase